MFMEYLLFCLDILKKKIQDLGFQNLVLPQLGDFSIVQKLSDKLYLEDNCLGKIM